MKPLMAFVALVVVAIAVQAQTQAPAPAFNAAGPVGTPVKDAPYSAEVVTTYERTLPSGQLLHGETHGKVYRDSQGRTRTESDAVASAATAEKSVFIVINDPVNHSVMTLDPRTMTARVTRWPFPAAGSVPGAPKQAVTENPPAAPSEGPAKLSAAAVPLAAGGVPGMNTEDLGTREMEGLTVSGTRTTRTLPAGIGGDQQPRTMVSTTWVSADLKVAVETETDDGQAGHHTTTLVNIVRTEPVAGLFQIPSGYTVADNRPQK
jgi:outer membrane lipoprotein-sorting protein